ncbi:hypothetical protein BGZ61DRAFT_566155, partial [Ilyonectria robusta]|uniref:uncharacterized protein n=1 Tax=Ilyonectria robusta TaxID=1079257 RepID=UPI001E8E7CC2
KKNDPSLQVALYTKCKTSEEPKIQVVYPVQIEDIKTMLAKVIPGLPEHHIRVVRYYADEEKAKDPKLAAGKLILCYDPKAEPGKIGCDVWAGSQYDAQGEAILPINNNSPILSCRWSERNYGELYRKPCLGVKPAPSVVPDSLPGATEVLTSFISAASATSVKTSKELDAGTEEASVWHEVPERD